MAWQAKEPGEIGLVGRIIEAVKTVLAGATEVGMPAPQTTPAVRTRRTELNFIFGIP